MPHLKEKIIIGVIDERIFSSYITILSAVTDICQQRLGESIPIIVHGYDYAVADGRGYMGGFSILPGPWLEPGFREKGYGGDTMQLRVYIVKSLIDRLNIMLNRLVQIGPFTSHVKYLDLRGTLSNSLQNEIYKEYWRNELHPSKEGFQIVTNKFSTLISTL